jgi:UDP-N-acetyl-D-galactosamine dehydrogenase
MHNRTISVIGLGYVGLPVAVAFGKIKRTVGFDVNSRRISELKKGVDRNGEFSPSEIQSARIVFTDKIEDVRQADFHIVTIPTPIDKAHRPDLSFLIKATEMLGKVLKKGDIVVYESTVYPGVTEEECLPVLERISGLKGGTDFKVGYSPERINMGDKEHNFTAIKKIVSGQDPESLAIIAAVYESVVKAGVHRVSSIKAAEAAKVIENTQRDLNIALMNELAIVFDLMNIDTMEVLAAASTKWNFLKFSPGLVGGHCIGVDPYYLTHKAEELGYLPQVILAGRRINDGMGKFVAQRAIKEMIHAHHQVRGSRVTVLGLTFKENCRDTRNSKVVDIVRELEEYGIKVQVHDSNADQETTEHEYGLKLMPWNALKPAAAVIVAVAHDEYRKMTIEHYAQLMGTNPVLIDVKGILNPAAVRAAGIRYWSL